ISTDGAFFSVIASMEGEPLSGAEPRSGLTEAPNGQLLGTTRIGGGADQGVIYRLNRNGSGFETLRHLGFSGFSGARSRSPLLRAPGNVFYGMTFGGGFNDRGVIFRYFLPELIP
ncbi:MAG TPA: choice-of-anchor tandem repeat GloVer-containing protein, partial [Verrucomicrobiae bacterium]|nr:choice-of-anchor tandem repeat GloVer-containing protein [Verrucomicrobiae bacterium]